jgi:hypothetical protein
MSRHHKVHRMPGQCIHLVFEDACVLCARAELGKLVERIERAVTAARSSSHDFGGGSGGTPSYELVNVAALSLLQDMHRVRSATDRDYLKWRNRARVILTEAFASRPLVTDTDPDPETGVIRSRPVLCPEDECEGRLLVQRNSDHSSSSYGRPDLITCAGNGSHRWEYRFGGFLRLNVKLLAKKASEDADAA